MTDDERDMAGFLGEFACCEMLGIDWKCNTRNNYLTIDEYDMIYKGNKIDVKSETLPEIILSKICDRTINDNKTWGRRLINSGQIKLLHKYDIVVFGGFIRGDYDYWYPFGYLETNYILQNYLATNKRPGGGIYNSPALPIKTSDLKTINSLYIRKETSL